MTVLFYYLTAGGGGGANVGLLLRAMASEYPADRYIVVSLTPHIFAPEPRSAQNISMYPLSSRAPTEVMRAWLGCGGLKRITERLRPDVMWAVNLGSYVGIPCPAVLTVNNAYQVYPPSVAHMHPANRIWVAALRWCFRRSLANSRCAVAQTTLMAEYIRAVQGAPAMISVIPKAVEGPDEVHPLPLPPVTLGLLGNCRIFTFLYVATATPHKNHRTIVRAVQLLRERGAKCRLVLTISREQLLSIAGVEAQKLIEAGVIIPVGHISKAYLRALYDACDACLVPSVLESLSSAHLEAMKWRKPLVSADTRFSRELCGSATLYAQATNPIDWVAKMQELMCNSQWQAVLAQAGERVMMRFPQSWRDVAGAMRAVLVKSVALRAVRPCIIILALAGGAVGFSGPYLARLCRGFPVCDYF